MSCSRSLPALAATLSLVLGCADAPVEVEEAPPGADLVGDSGDEDPGTPTVPPAGEGEATRPPDDTHVRDEVEELPEEEWVEPDALDQEELAAIRTQRLAIERGLDLGKISFSDELNRVLGVNGMDFAYQSSIARGVEYVPPAPRVECPFLLSEEDAQARTTDCRSLTDRAKVSTYGQLTSLLAADTLGPEFDVDRTVNEYWHEQGAMTGIDNETSLAIRHLREIGLCDRGLEPVSGAFEAGVEAGRALYIDRLNARLAETGNPMNYPDNIQQIQVCTADAAFLAPARTRALAAVEQDIVSRPLCGEDFSPSDVDEANRLNEAETRYEQGYRQGIQTEHSHASERIFRVVPCNVGDPLVLDLDGDGVRVEPVHASRVEFDLFGWGEPVRTAWIGRGDGFLALDRDGDGRIASGNELFVNFLVEEGAFRELPSGFENLARHDANGDGRVDSADPIWSRLSVWVDADSDGQTDPGELRTLEAAGVSAIPVRYEAVGAMPLPHGARFTRADGETGAVRDAWFGFGRARPSR